MRGSEYFNRIYPGLLACVSLCAFACAGSSARQEDWVLRDGGLFVNGKRVFLKIAKPLRNFGRADDCRQLIKDLDVLAAKGYNAFELNCYWHHLDTNGDGEVDVSLKPLIDLIDTIHAKGLFPCLSVETYGVGGGQIPQDFWTKYPDAAAVNSEGKQVRDEEYGFMSAVPSLFHEGYLKASRLFIYNLTKALPFRKILHYETTVEPQFMGQQDIGYSASAKSAYEKWLKEKHIEGPAWPRGFPVPKAFSLDPVWLRFRAESLADWVNRDAEAYRAAVGKDAYIAVDYLETCNKEMYKRNGNSDQFLAALSCADIIQVNWHWHNGTRSPNKGAYDHLHKAMKETGRKWAISEHMTLNGSDYRPDEVDRILRNALENGTGYGFEFVNVAKSSKDKFALYNDDWSAKPLMAEVDGKWAHWRTVVAEKFAGK